MSKSSGSQLALRCTFSLPLLLSLSCGVSSDSSLLESIKPEALNGTWAKQFVLSSSATAAGTQSKSKVIRLSLVTLQNQGNSIEAQEQVCDVATLNSGATSISFAPSILNAFENRRYSYTLAHNGGSPKLVLNNGVEVLGSRLSDPFKDEIPKQKGDPRIVDHDKDGQPGVTVKVQAKLIISVSGDLYVSQRTFWQEEAAFENENSISGKVSWKQEQHILDTNNQIFTAIIPKVTTLADESTVSLKRLPAASDCESLKAQANSLFAQVNI